MLGIKDERLFQGDYLVEKEFRKKLRERIELVRYDRKNPMRSAWVRLVRRVLMNACINRDGRYAFDYETDEEDFQDPKNGIKRSPRTRRRRLLRQRPVTPVLKSTDEKAKGKPLVPPKYRHEWLNSLRTHSELYKRFKEMCGKDDKSASQDPSSQSASSAVTTMVSESVHTTHENTEKLEVLVASGGHASDKVGKEDISSFVTLGTYEVDTTRSNSLCRFPQRSSDAGPYRPPVCRLRVTVGETPIPLDVCVDSGATLSLLSKDMYKRLRYSKWLDELKRCRQKLHGASGKSLNIIGVSKIYFRVEGIIYSAPVFVGDLTGVDMLLGMDWLIRARAKIDFEDMTLKINPQHTVKLSTTPWVRRDVFTVSTDKSINIQDRFDDLIPGSVHGFASVVESREVKAGSAILVTCQITGRWEDGIDAMYIPSNQTLGPGVLTVESIDTPKLRGDSHTLDVMLSNAGDSTFTVGAGTILGHVEPLLRDLRPDTAIDPKDRAGVFHITVGPDEGAHVLVEETLPIGREMLFPIGARCGEDFKLDESNTSPVEDILSTQDSGVPSSTDSCTSSKDVTVSGSSRPQIRLPGPEFDAKATLGKDSENPRTPFETCVEGTPREGTRGYAPNPTVQTQGERSSGVDKDPQQILYSVEGGPSVEISDTDASEILNCKEGAGRLDSAGADNLPSGGHQQLLAVREKSKETMVDNNPKRDPKSPTRSTEKSRTVEGRKGDITVAERLRQRLESQQNDRRKQNIRPSKKQAEWPEVREHLRCMLPDRSTLKRGQAKMIIALLEQFDDVFVGPEGEVGFTDQVQHRIEIDETKPPFKSKPRAKSHSDREFIEKTVAKLLKEGKIKPSKSPWGAPVVLVRKKDGNLRFCVDFRELNDVTKKDAYPIPRIDEMLDGLNGSKYFCTLDLASGYWQIAMHRDDMEKTAFITHIGLYEWKVLPFGLCNAPATFCRLMETVMSDIIWSKCMVYLDDIIAFGKTFEATLENLRAVFERLKANTLKLSPKKCSLFKTKVEYLGHEVSDEGIKPSPAKVNSLHNMAMPRTITQIKSFVGFCSYYRRFIKHFSELAVPLNDLTKKGALVNTDTPECRRAFEDLKKSLMEAPMLHYVDPKLPFILDTDASDNAIGACLAQIAQDEDGKPYERPIAFASKTLNASRRRYCTTKKELYAVVYYLNYWRSMLSGCDLIVRTDHYSLLWLLSFEKEQGCPGMYFRWASQITTHNMVRSLKIVHRPGAAHVNADALSRLIKKRQCRLDKGETLNGCKSIECEECKLEAKYNREARGSDSEDSDDEESGYESDESEGYIDVPVHVLLNTRLEYELKDPVLESPSQGTLQDIQFVDGTSTEVYHIGEGNPDEVYARLYVARAGELRRGDRRSARIAEKVASRQAQETVPSGVAEKPPSKKVALSRDLSPRLSPRESSRQKDPPIAGTKTAAAMKDSATQIDATQLGFNTKEGQPLLNRVPEEDSQHHSLVRVVEICPAWSDAEWVQSQEKDPIIARVRELVRERDKTGSQDSAPPSFDRELPEVKAYLKYYSKLYFAPSNVLCLQENKTFGIDENDIRILRLAPVDFRVAIFQRVHKRDLLHYSYEKVFPILRDRFWWTNMSQDILDWCKACESCQKIKPGVKGGRTVLRQDRVVYRPMHRVAIDLITFRYATDRGNRVILSVVDYASRWIELFALKDKTAETVESVIYDEYLTRYGAPLVMHSDQGREFDNKLMMLTMRRWGVDKTRTSGFAPWSNGLVERLNRPIKMMLTQFGEDHRNNWDAHLPKVRMAINCAVASTTGFTPHRLFFSRCEEARMPIDLLACEKPLVSDSFDCPTEYVVKQEKLVAEVMSLARKHINAKIRLQAENHARGGLRMRRYRVGDYVLRRSTTDGPLQARWTGPYKVHDVVESGHLVKLLLPMAGRSSDRGQPRMELKWTHTSNVKPVKLDRHGRLLVTMEDDDPSEVLQVVEEGEKANEKDVGGIRMIACEDAPAIDPAIETVSPTCKDVTGDEETPSLVGLTAFCNAYHLSTVFELEVPSNGTNKIGFDHRKGIDWSCLLNPQDGRGPRLPPVFCEFFVDGCSSVTMADVEQSPILFGNLIEYEEEYEW